MPFRMLFCNTNDTLVKLKISITSGISLPDKTCYQNTLIYDSDKKNPKKTCSNIKVDFLLLQK